MVFRVAFSISFIHIFLVNREPLAHIVNTFIHSEPYYRNGRTHTHSKQRWQNEESEKITQLWVKQSHTVAKSIEKRQARHTQLDLKTERTKNTEKKKMRRKRTRIELYSSCCCCRLYFCLFVDWLYFFFFFHSFFSFPLLACVCVFFHVFRRISSVSVFFSSTTRLLLNITLFYNLFIWLFLCSWLSVLFFFLLEASYSMSAIQKK